MLETQIVINTIMIAIINSIYMYIMYTLSVNETHRSNYAHINVHTIIQSPCFHEINTSYRSKFTECQVVDNN